MAVGVVQMAMLLSPNAAVTTRVTSTRASLKQAPPPMSVGASGTSALAVEPFSVLRRHRPLGRPTVPGFMSALSATGH